MEAEFREIDENGSWNAIYQVGPPPAPAPRHSPGGRGPLSGQTVSEAHEACGVYRLL